MPTRSDIEFRSGSGTCTGWLFRPDGTATGLPCVVLAHGFAACKEGRLEAFAEHFAAAGMVALVFDYRHFGASTGEPRQLVDVGRQHRDWQAAVAHARKLEGVDPERVILWGTSFSGGHVVWVAARDERIAAVVSQEPHASGVATLKATGAGRAGKMTVAGLRDQLAALFGKAHCIAIVGPPGSLAAMTTDDAETEYPAMYPPGFEFRNEVPARFALRLAAYSPLRSAAKVRCPLLVIVAERDTVTPPKPARRIADRAPRGELLAYDGTHFDIYRGEPFERAVTGETEFLHRVLDTRPRS